MERARRPTLPRPRKLTAFAAGAVLLIVATVAAVWLVLPEVRTTPGPVDTRGIQGSGFAIKVGALGSWGKTVIYNDSDADVVLDAVRPLDVPAGLDVQEVLIAGPDRKLLYLSGSREWPADDLTDLGPVAGARIAPASTPRGDRGAEIVLVLRARAPGRYVLSKLEVSYRQGRKQHRRVVSGILALCAREQLTGGPLDCPLPDQVPE